MMLAMSALNIATIVLLLFPSSFSLSSGTPHGSFIKDASVTRVRKGLSGRQGDTILNVLDQTMNFKDLAKQAKTTDNTCKLELYKSSINKFRHIVFYSQAIFVYLELVPDTGINITGSRIIVGENIWVWTFYGKEGGLEFLNWPVEFGIWSMGLLTSYAITDPMTMQLKRVSGNCSNLEVGKTAVDRSISKALVNLTLEMIQLNEKYGPSFFCYLTRKLIEPHFVYVLCKHIVCPVEVLKYNCCSYFFNVSILNRSLGCKESVFEYDQLNWILPTIVSVILFGFCPIFILHIGHLVSDEGRGHLKGVLRSVVQNNGDVDTHSDNLVLLDDHHHVTLFKTHCLPFKSLCLNLHSKASPHCQMFLSKIVRIFIPFFSLIVIALQVCLDYFYLHTFVLESVRKGVPLGFRSILAGYRESKLIFLPYLGGPYISVAVYLFVTCILLVIPKSVSELLLSGLSGNDVNESYSPLIIRLRSVEIFGSINLKKRHGYYKLYSVFLAQFFMLINKKFWKHVITVQLDRWKRFAQSKLCIILLPFYLIVCLIEIALCIVMYGFPVISFVILIIKSYCGRLCSQETRRKCPQRLLFFFLTVVFIGSVLYFLFMFCTIFMDSCLFVTRVVVFTFIGIVVYPKVSYGYLIFTLTVIYYLWQSIKEYSLVYQQLLKDTVSTCESLQRANDREKLVIKSQNCKAIKEALFEHVIENHLPRRKQVFLSILKVVIILTLLGLSINILIDTDGFRELHVVMHVGTALFICALPQIVKSMCRGWDEKFKHKRFRRELSDTIYSYIGYTVTESTDSETN